MYEAIKDAIYDGSTYACATVDTNDGYIDLYVNNKGEVDAQCGHDAKTLKRRESRNVELFCESVLKDLDSWQEIEDDCKAESAPTPEEEYLRLGETMFAPEMRWHRI